MAEMSEDVKKALEEQKANCPFCKIIKGEIPSKKVYEDDKVMAVLDINPASKGHILVMPKEHYPILPYVPYEDFKHLFEITKDIVKCIRGTIARTGANIFIANGWVAGQQSQHFMLHIIPREENDGLFLFNMQGEFSDKEKEDEAFNIISNNLPIMMNNHFKQHPVDWHKPSGAGGDVMRKFTKEQVIEIIEKNPNLKDWIIKDPHSLVKQAGSHEQLKMLFANVDVLEVIKHFNKEYEPKEEGEEGESEEIEEAEDIEEAGAEDDETEEGDEEIEETEGDEDDDETEGEEGDVLNALKGEEEPDEDDDETEEETEEEDDETEEIDEEGEEAETEEDEVEEDKEGANLDNIANLFK